MASRSVFSEWAFEPENRNSPVNFGFRRVKSAWESEICAAECSPFWMHFRVHPERRGVHPESFRPQLPLGWIPKGNFGIQVNRNTGKMSRAYAFGKCGRNHRLSQINTDFPRHTRVPRNVRSKTPLDASYRPIVDRPIESVSICVNLRFLLLRASVISVVCLFLR